MEFIAAFERIMLRLLVVLVLALPGLLFAQNIQKGLAPGWVANVIYKTEISDTLHAGGEYYLLSETQYHGEKKQAFYRYASKVLTEKGLESVSAIEVNYDPSYQRLTFNSIIIWRDGKKIDVLPRATFEVLRREKNLDRLIYDKSIDAICNVEDVHVGDIIEYSFTLTGENPVFEDKIFQSNRLNHSVPVAKSYDRLICRASRVLEFKTYNHASLPVEENRDGMTSYVWEMDGVPAIETEDSSPAWYNPYDRIQISEYKEWSEITRWALTLFSTKGIVSTEIDEKIADIKKNHTSAEEQINSAIRFVQDEIRYLSFSDGIQGYKPHSPSQVIKQRFGDCKDKSHLLAFMLNKMGVDSYPALVNTSYGRSLNEYLPNPAIFDHCIVQLKFQDSTYWVDPTLTLERGSFKKSAEANYYNALVISPTTASLQPIDFNTRLSKIKVQESYSFKTIGGSATLSVKTIFEGDEANSIRNYYKSSSAEEVKKSYTNFYAMDYSDISMIGFVRFEDDVINNVVTTTENYEIENFWQYDSATSKFSTEFYARILAQQLNLPSSKRRKTPLSVSYPTAVEQNIFIYLPEPWTVTEKQQSYSSPAFKYSSEVDYVDQTVKMYYKYTSLKDHVTAEESRNHIDKIEKASSDLSFELSYSYNSDGTVASKVNASYVVVIGLAMITLIIIAAKKFYP